MEVCQISDNINSDFKIIENIVNEIHTSRKFISKISNGTDYSCSLCNHTITHSPSDKKFRLSLWTHINEATHRQNVQISNINDMKNEIRKQTQKIPKSICVQLKNALDSFQLSKQENILSSKEFIIKNKEGNDFHCTLCDVELSHSSIKDDEFRFNLLVHINKKCHKFKLTTHKNCNDETKIKGNKAADKDYDNNGKEKSELEEKSQVEMEESVQISNSKARSNKQLEIKSGKSRNKKKEQEIGGDVNLKKGSKGEKLLVDHSDEHFNKKSADASNFKARVKTEYVEKNEKPKKSRNKKVNSHELKDVFDSFEQCNPVTDISKDFILRGSAGKDYYCTLCDVEILYPLNDNEFRFNLWSHINDKTHREKLPNYKDIIKSFEKEKEKISKSLPAAYKDDADFFVIGVKYRLAKCSLCDVAVSLNFHRLTNHIKGEEHTINRRSIMLGQEGRKIDPLVRSRREYTLLKSKIDGKFKKDMKFIQAGEMPGYVVCVVCCHVVLATKYYLETHFEMKCHGENCPLRPVIKSNMNLSGLMQYMPIDLKAFQNIFVEDKCGIKCCRCQELIPATTHDLYSHIIKERDSDK